MGNEWYDAHIANLTFLTLIPGVHELLQSLQGKVTLVVGSDAIREVAKIKLDYLQLARHFKKVYTQDDVDSFKDEPKFYETIAADQGVQLGEMMYVGNRPERGIDTAQALGMYTILVPHLEHLQIREKIPADVRPDLQTKDLVQVRDFILRAALS
jgi:FMN phosphatase YigB (HAD superfamily)